MSKKEKQAYKRGIIDTVLTIGEMLFFTWIFIECLIR